MKTGLDTTLFLFACAVFSALATWFSIRYAHRRAMLDMPGQRRSHSMPTPRGGGVGIVASVLAGLAILLFGGSGTIFGVWILASVILVAAAGWIDDHRGLSVHARLLLHVLATAALYWPLFRFLVFVAGHGGGPASRENDMAIALIGIAFVLAGAWFINLHNFMDGINGLLASQAIFVFVVLAWLVAGDNRTSLWLCVAAVAGFLPFNFPRARIFMGDVGSGTLGLLIAAAVALQALSFHGSPFSGLIACSAFVVDATCTLLSRMLRGRRWYSAHREHLYQWLVRSGFSHARVVAFYMGWNLFFVLPVLYAVNRGGVPVPPTDGLVWMLAVYALALVAWVAGKRWCLRHAGNVKKAKSIR
jgi:UDP-N-acetylmuramyl pentapeptide phosphotransferase/UDP-N-acetylglucosamine-1-phosphate transferase